MLRFSTHIFHASVKYRTPNQTRSMLLLYLIMYLFVLGFPKLAFCYAIFINILHRKERKMFYDLFTEISCINNILMLILLLFYVVYFNEKSIKPKVYGK